MHPLRAPACCISTKLVENYKHTQGHSGALPASHRAHLIQPETQQLPPSVCLHVGLQLFHYLFEQIGLRLVCGGLIVMRDERLQRARCMWLGFAEPLCCVKHTVDLSWSQRLLHFSWTVGHRCVDICHPLCCVPCTDGRGNVLAGLRTPTFGGIYIYETIKSTCSVISSEA